jgi:hypothetical protein
MTCDLRNDRASSALSQILHCWHREPGRPSMVNMLSPRENWAERHRLFVMEVNAIIMVEEARSQRRECWRPSYLAIDL